MPNHRAVFKRNIFSIIQFDGKNYSEIKKILGKRVRKSGSSIEINSKQCIRYSNKGYVLEDDWVKINTGGFIQYGKGDGVFYGQKVDPIYCYSVDINEVEILLDSKIKR